MARWRATPCALAATLLAGTAAADEFPVRFLSESWVDGYFRSPAEPLFGPPADRTPVLLNQRLWAGLDMALAPGLAIGFDGYLAATLPDTLRGVVTEPGDRSLRAHRADVTRLMLRVESADADLIVGRAPLEVGLGDLYRPTDRFEARNLANPVHPMRMGAWQATLQVPLGPTDTLTLSVLPFDDRGAQPGPGSRWRGAIGDADFYDFPGFAFLADPAIVALADLRFEDRFRTRFLQDWGWLAMVRGERSGGDFQIGAHIGPGAFPTLEVRGRAAPTLTGAPQITVTKVLPTAATLFAGGALALDSARLTLEGLFQHTPGNRDDDFLRLTAGVTLRLEDVADALGLRDVGLSGQYAREIVTRRMTSTALPFDASALQGVPSLLLPTLVNIALAQPASVRVSSESARANRDTLIGELRLVVDAWTTIRARGAYNFDDGDRALSVAMEHRLGDATTLEGAIFLIDGRVGSPFGRFDRNDGVFVGVRHRF
ncbi:MAG: hypothetical protein IT561_22405 [Alphaproteobacteria bacterium]|nr:hypothetical protein [Alphaproteobacteria bacterium]